MTWEERLLFLMFLDYKGVLEKWEKNHNECSFSNAKIDSHKFWDTSGFIWAKSPEGHYYWENLMNLWTNSIFRNLKVGSLNYEIRYMACDNYLKVGCQKITKKDALKIADFIYECFGEEV